MRFEHLLAITVVVAAYFQTLDAAEGGIDEYLRNPLSSLLNTGFYAFFYYIAASFVSDFFPGPTKLIVPFVLTVSTFYLMQSCLSVPEISVNFKNTCSA